jgi:hypothetical protein
VWRLTRVATQVNFGTCFVRYPYTRHITVTNDSDHPAKYEILKQDEHSAIIAEYTTESARGSIEPHTQQTIPITLVCDQLGKINLPLQIRVSGDQQPPMLATLEATSVGPKVVADVAEVSWGRIGCLVDSTRTLSLHNDSLIPAPFKTFVKSARSKFKVDVLEGMLAPDERVTLTVTANLDDTLPHKDELHVVVTDGENLVVVLKAIGSGTTLHCDPDISRVDFGHVFTTNVCTRTFMMENKGRRVQSLQWINATTRDQEAALRRKVLVVCSRVVPFLPVLSGVHSVAASVAASVPLSLSASVLSSCVRKSAVCLCARSHRLTVCVVSPVGCRARRRQRARPPRRPLRRSRPSRCSPSSPTSRC